MAVMAHLPFKAPLSGTDKITKRKLMLLKGIVTHVQQIL